MNQATGVVILVDINYLEGTSKKGRGGARRVVLTKSKLTTQSHLWKQGTNILRAIGKN